MPSLGELGKSFRGTYGLLLRSIAQVKAGAAQMREEAQVAYSQEIADAKRRLRCAGRDALVCYWHQALELLASIRESVDPALRGLLRDWTHETWSSWEPLDLAKPPMVRIGTFTYGFRTDLYAAERIGPLLEDNEFYCPACKAIQSANRADGSGSSSSGIKRYCRECGSLLWDPHSNRISTFPATVPFLGDRNLVFRGSGDGKDKARQCMQSVILRLLASMPAGKLRLTCLDPVGLGASVAGFVHDLPENLSGGTAWTDQRDIEDQLKQLERHIANVRQSYLGARFHTIEEYNDEQGVIEEPYRLLVVYDYPTRFTSDSRDRLLGIMANGPSVGVYTLLLEGTIPPESREEYSLGDALQHAWIVHSGPESASISTGDETITNPVLTLDGAPPPDTVTRICSAVTEKYEQSEQVAVPLSKALDPWDGWAKALSSQNEIRTPIGQRGANEVQELVFDSGLHTSALIVGQSGSGKTNLLHVIVQGLCRRYSPEELRLFLVDLKEVEFGMYAKTPPPHADIVATECGREYGLGVLESLEAELERRMKLLRSGPRGTENSLSTYRSATGESLPRIVMVCDEFQDLICRDDALARRANAIITRIVEEGRAFGLHLVLATQSLGASRAQGGGLAKAVIDLVPIRIVLRSSEAESRFALAENNDAASLLERQGQAIYNESMGQPRGNQIIQIYYQSNETVHESLQEFREVPELNDRWPAENTMVFAGDELADLSRSLRSRLGREAFAALSSIRDPAGLLGEPMTLAMPVIVSFPRQGGANLLIVGQAEDTAGGMISSLLTTMRAGQATDVKDLQIYVRGLGQPDGTLGQWLNRLEHDDIASLTVLDNQRLGATILELAADLDRRESEESFLPNVLLVVFGLHRARDLWPTDPRYTSPEEDSTSVSQAFARLLRQGPSLGIHTLAWASSVNGLHRTLGPDLLHEFDMLVALQMGYDDSQRYLGTSQASDLGPYRAVYSNVADGTLLEFRPYATPSTVPATGKATRSGDSATKEGGHDA